MQIRYQEFSKRTQMEVVSATFLQPKDLESAQFNHLIENYGELVTSQIGDKKFEGKPGQLIVLPKRQGGGYLIGLGIGEMKTANDLRTAIGALVQKAESLKASGIDLTVHAKIVEIGGLDDVVLALQETLLMSQYTFTKYKEASPKSIQNVEVYLEAENLSIESVLKLAEAKVAGAHVTRDLVNTTANDMTPTLLAKAAEEIASTDSRMTIEVHGEDWARAQGMGSYLAVDQGSDEPCKFIHVVYKPEGATKKVALVGKGVTFDSGGLSLKPSNYMDTMKCDMAGAATVLGVFKALTTLDVPVEVHGYIAATENMPSGKAIRPGDVVRAANGKTIEILNTDAEGRLTLADALWYAQKESPDHIVDFATLTGACVVALGEHVAAALTDDDALVEAIQTSAKKNAEELWRLPLQAGYAKHMKSEIADLRNISKTSYGGAITAGLFLKEFVEEGQSWMHMDIAGPAYVSEPYANYIGKDGTGYAVRTMVDWLQSL